MHNAELDLLDQSTERNGRWVATIWLLLTLAAILSTCSGCCQSYLRRDDDAPPAKRFYLVRVCPWGDTTLCNSATKLPADTTEGSCK